MSRYAISDIHGCCRTFRYLVEEILQLQPTDQLYLLGDYIDRGPDSKGVIDFIMHLQETGYAVQALSGNHEALMLDARKDPEYVQHWCLNGGDTTLKSFGVKTVAGIPEKYWHFLQQLYFYRPLKDYLLVHAGFNFASPQPFEDIEAMLWIRNFAVDKKVIGNRKIVHGHTPTPANKIYLTTTNSDAQVINIDGGCVYKQVPGLGYLTALDLDSLELHVVPNQDK